MYRKYYLNYFIANILGCTFYIVYISFIKNITYHKGILLAAWLFGLIIMHVLIIRLPIFNKYYLNRKKLRNFLIQHPSVNLAEAKAAPVMNSLFSATIFGLILISVGIDNHIFEYAFLAGISAGIMSYYYAP